MSDMRKRLNTGRNVNGSEVASGGSYSPRSLQLYGVAFRWVCQRRVSKVRHTNLMRNGCLTCMRDCYILLEIVKSAE